jgi:hypothetical protein
MVWGTISMNGPSVLAWVEESLDSEKYCEMVETELLENPEFDKSIHLF